ncbi:MAG TPA: O-antigen ligase family protein [Anaerolineaceae bacterium]|nr:O-antigen ligase family protein [Anaerolineaceae bacterium]
MPTQVVPIFLFFLVALLSTALASFRLLPGYRNDNPLMNNLESFVTLGVGIAFYITTYLFIRDEKTLKFSIACINIGGVLILLASVLQFASWKLFQNYPDLLQSLQSLVSSSGRLFARRVNGLAYEPSWLAHQINIIYLPIWFGLVLKGQSIYHFRLFRKVSLEVLLLIGGFFSLFASLSRIGWLTAIAMIGFLIIRKANDLKKKAVMRFFSTKKNRSALRNALINSLFWLSVVSLILLIGFSILKLLTIVEPTRMANFFNLIQIREKGILTWASRLELAERFIYWQTAFITFLTFPLLGVGLGNAGYYFLNNLPSFGYGLPEIMNYVLFNSNVANPKNLWIRILAETGIIGFAVFFTWFYGHIRMAGKLDLEPRSKLTSVVGLIGILLSISFVLEGFSMDTFGLPYYWIGFGLVMGVYRFSQTLYLEPAENH